MTDEPAPRARSTAKATRAKTALIGLLLTSSFVSPLLAQDRSAPRPAAATTFDGLESAFADPPATARPRVWWHWMNGNITRDGIHKDLEWMKRAGIAGAQVFDANLATPQIVDKPLAYMTPEWKDAFHYAASEANRLGLELAIASSPGWSETGGPWVKPADGMKKIAWSETILEGGRPFKGKLPAPPVTTGSFQDSVVKSTFADLLGDTAEPPTLYRDAAAFAYRISNDYVRPFELQANVGGKQLDAAALSDGLYATRVHVPKGSAAAPTTINLTLTRPQTVRSLSLFVAGAASFGSASPIKPRLEVNAGGTWRKVADITLSAVPTTVSFAPTTAQQFRVVLAYDPTAAGLDLNAAPGFDIAPLMSVIKSDPDYEIADLRLLGEPRVNQWETKAGFSTSPDYYALSDEGDPNAVGLAPSDVVDLTGKVAADGSLNWTPPKGKWRVVRMGWSLTGKQNHPARADATGLEVDKLDGDAVRRYLQTYLDMYRTTTGPDLFGARGVRALLNDSTEVGAFNWTPRMLEQFQRLRGYDPRPWLPVLTGAIVGSRARSDAFLYDFRRTIADLHATEHYGTIATVAHEYGLKVYGESLEGTRFALGDDLDMRRFTDIPMAAQWTWPEGKRPQPVHEADMRGAASIAHFYGQNLVAAESMTASMHPWAFAPADLRKVIDLEFASGVNRPVVHTSAHVPRDDRQPGVSLFIFGQYFNRMETWAEMAKPWVDYMARSALLLQSGRNVADVAYFYGEEEPVGPMSAAGLPTDRPTHYAYDFVSAKMVGDDLKVEGGELVSPGGARYRVLYLGGTSARMTLPMLRKIADLADQGATIVGTAPVMGAGLGDDTPEYQQLVKRLWTGGAVTAVGKGRVVAGKDVEAALHQIDVAADFSLINPPVDAQVRFVHRTLPDGDVYFISNRHRQPAQLDARFRVTGKAPEIWRADAGTRLPASYRIEKGSTVVPLDLAAEESYFVVFRKAATAPSRTIPATMKRVVAEVSGAWEIAFQAGRGAPATTRLPALASLSLNANPAIKYFSGVATYQKVITAPPGYRPGQPLLIDLGQVGDIAEVRINGQFAGTAWHSPFEVDIGKFMKGGRNTLDIRVADLWVNRLIGDKQPGASKITFTTTPTYVARAPLRPSGLIGPVRLIVPQ